jgi:uncharacterized membrane protein
MDLFIGLGLCFILLPVNITLTFMSFRYDPKAVFIFIGGAMFFNLVASGICLSIVVSMLCKVAMTMRNLHTSDQIKELKKLKAKLEKLQR